MEHWVPQLVRVADMAFIAFNLGNDDSSGIKEIAEHFKFARIWGSGKFDGQRIPADYELEDGDIVEINT